MKRNWKRLIRSPTPRIVRAGSGLSVHLAINAEKVQTIQKDMRNLIDLRVNGVAHDLITTLWDAQLLNEVLRLVAAIEDPEITLWKVFLLGLGSNHPDVQVIYVVYASIPINPIKGLEETLIASLEN
jgi:hypothetical protein